MLSFADTLVENEVQQQLKQPHFIKCVMSKFILFIQISIDTVLSDIFGKKKLKIGFSVNCQIK